MAIQKLYIGRKVRELRQAQQSTLAQFAERLGISKSYLNQIENNQRPVSAAVLLALAEKFRIDLSEFSQTDSDRMLSVITEALSDPLFDTYEPNLQELKLVTQNAPGFARALISCHHAYRRAGEQLASLSSGDEGVSTAEPTPYEEVRDFFHFVDNYIHELDQAAEKLAVRIGVEEREVSTALTSHLELAHGVRIARSDEDDLIRRFDRPGKILFLNTYLPAATRSFQMAFQIGELEMASEVAAIVNRAEFRSREAADVCRMGLYNYFAGALVLPYGSFVEAARTVRHDLELLAVRFGASIEQVAHRLSTLQRPGAKGVPFFFARLDRAGNITKRHSAAKLQFARFGGACPLWNVHEAFETPGRFIRQLAETPDGARYLSVATELRKAGGGYNAPQRRYAIALGCEVTYADSLVYSDGLDMTNKLAFDPIGISCRICQRPNCVQRAVPPLKARLIVDRNHRATLPYSIS